MTRKGDITLHSKTNKIAQESSSNAEAGEAVEVQMYNISESFINCNV